MPDSSRQPNTLTPTLDEVRALAASRPADGGTSYRRIPVKRELYADGFTPVEAMRRLRAASHHCFLLESAEDAERWGRYSFLGFAPTVEVTCANGLVRIRRGAEGAAQEIEERAVEHPRDVLRELIAEHRSPQLPGFPPFTGGLVGYFSYDYIKYAEPTLRAGDDELEHGDFLDMDLMLFDTVLAFDNHRQKLVLMTGVPVNGPAADEDVAAAYAAAVARLDEVERILRDGARHPFAPLELAEPLTPRFSRERYCAMVDEVKHHIYEGDIFQLVLSNPLRARAAGSLFDTYRVLRCQNPSPYMFYFTSDDIELAGASPETLVRLTDGDVYTYPLAGTRPRGSTREEDEALERELLADEKELAEHNMLVDLGRNDLGRVCAFGSVHVEEHLNILRFSRVMHIGSTVAGKIAPGKDALDAVDAILPAGTLSGAPKLSACQIIQRLEGTKRGIYGGAIGYLDLSGNMDTCIGIRLAYKKDGCVCVQSGAGIVADSVPEREAQECRNKTRAVEEALRAAEGGIA